MPPSGLIQRQSFQSDNSRRGFFLSRKMTKLTKLQKEYISRHNIPISWMFDASGLTRRRYHDLMKLEDKYFAYGVVPCKNGHSLRTRSGDCIQCFPASIRFQMRYFEVAYVYIAGSKQLKLIKIGSSKDPENRIYIANLDGHEYAGASDWRLLFSMYVRQAGKIETDVHSQLRPFQRQISFCRNGTKQTATECYSCSYQKAYFNLYLSLIGAGIFEGPASEGRQDILDQYAFGED